MPLPCSGTQSTIRLEEAMPKYRVTFRYQIVREVEAEITDDAVLQADKLGSDEYDFVGEEVTEIEKFWNEE